jgi:hypothetical protein
LIAWRNAKQHQPVSAAIVPAIHLNDSKNAYAHH